MADFCKECSEYFFGYDAEDFKGLTTQEDWDAGNAAVVLCEDCGGIQVNPEGICIVHDCKNHGKINETRFPIENSSLLK
jgi:hypothetical protein